MENLAYKYRCTKSAMYTFLLILDKFGIHNWRRTELQEQLVLQSVFGLSYGRRSNTMENFLDCGQVAYVQWFLRIHWKNGLRNTQDVSMRMWV